VLAAYEQPGLNYPPALAYWYYLAGALEARLAQMAGVPRDDVLNAALKLLPVLADTATGLVLAWAFRRRAPGLGLLAAVGYVFHPAIWYVSAYWGQSDSVYTLFIVLGILAFARGALLPAWCALALATLVKQQALAVVPVVAAATLGLHGRRGLAVGGAALAGVAAAISAPWLFSGRLPELVRGVTTLAGSPPRIVVSAYNFWYLQRWGDVHTAPAAQPLAGLPVSYQAVAIIVVGAATCWLAWHAWRARQAAIAPHACAACAMVYVFMFHARERYLFPVLALLLLAAAQQGLPLRRAWQLYAALSVTFAFNLVTIASPFPAGWTNLVASTAGTPTVQILWGLALLAAAWHTTATIWLLALSAIPTRVPDTA